MKSELVVHLIALGAVIAILLGIRAVNDLGWNGGYHSCGGRWVYQQAMPHNYETMFLYECDKCGKTKEFYKKRNGVSE